MSNICGVAYSYPQRPVDPKTLERMLHIMSHQDSGVPVSFLAPQVGLGIRGCYVGNSQENERPVSDEKETVTVVCGGQIYNAQALKKALVASGHHFRTDLDAEIILRLYQDHGVECVRRLRGMYGFALWDARIRRLMLGRDRLGLQPLVYALTDGGLVFGSEIKAVLSEGHVSREIDFHALKDLFTIGFVEGPHTLFEKIRRLSPGHYLLYQNGSLTIQQYWDIIFPEPEGEAHQCSEREWAEALHAKLKETVQLHLRGEATIGASLSGGIDSSVIVSLMHQLMKGPIHTFSLGYEYAPFDEVTGVKTLKDFPGFHLLNDHTLCKLEDFSLFPKAVWHCEDPFTTGLEIPRMLLSHLASRHVQVMLTGDGSDEIFGAYPWFRVDHVLRPMMRLPVRLRRMLATVPAIKRKWSRACRRLVASADMSRACYKQIIDSVHEDYNVDLFSDDLKLAIPSEDDDFVILPAGYQAWEPSRQLLYWELKMHLPDYTVRRVDAASKAYALETRLPFLDHELVELCVQIPLKFGLHAGSDKFIFRQAMKDSIPADIMNRPKRGLLAPYDQWVEHPLDFVRDLFSERQIREKGYFAPKMVGTLLERHRMGLGHHGRTLMGVLAVHLWHDQFVQGCRPT